MRSYYKWMLATTVLSVFVLSAANAGAAPGLGATPPANRDIATIAGGCFWAMEARFKLLKGVDSVTPGYAGGNSANPTYEQVCSDTTGYAESIQIIFDPKVLSYHDLIDIFMRAHDPTTKDRQGNDVGNSYRSAIFYRDAEQKAQALQVVHEIEAQRVYSAPIVTEVVPFTNFYHAEAYHFNYFALHPMNPYCMFVVAPEVQKFKERNRPLLKTQ